MTSTTWRGRRGAVILGPTEHRVARWLHEMTRHGRVTIRTVDLISALGLERSEAYRITARLRLLGLFGIENDRAGTNGGRRFWRTPTEHDGATLDRHRQRIAWSRIVGWARGRQARIAARLAELRATTHAASVGPVPRRAATPSVVLEEGPRAADGGTFAERMRQSGIGGWIDDRRHSHA